MYFLINKENKFLFLSFITGTLIFLSTHHFFPRIHHSSRSNHNCNRQVEPDVPAAWIVVSWFCLIGSSQRSLHPARTVAAESREIP